MSKFFEQFPTVTYGNKIARNLTVRLRFLETMFEKYNSYYPYYIKEGERPDMVAFNYYEDSALVWLVFLANNIIDPYHDWPLSEAQLRRMAIKKYGSIAAADSLSPPAEFLVSEGGGVSYTVRAE